MLKNSKINKMDLKMYIKDIENQILNTEEEIELLTNNIENPVIKTKIEIEQYFSLEKKMINFVENQKSKIKNSNYNKKYYQLKLLDYNLYKTLNHHFRNKCIKGSLRFLYFNLLNDIFYNNILPNYSCDKTFYDLLSKNEKDEKKNLLDFYYEICDLEIKKVNTNIIKMFNLLFMSSNDYITDLPIFLLTEKHKHIKNKILIVWRINYKIPLKDYKLLNKNEKDFEFLYEIFHDFFEGDVTVFDNKYILPYSEKDNIKNVIYENQNFMAKKLLIFKSFYISNINYLKNEINQKIFLDSISSFLKILEIDPKDFYDIITELKNINDNSKQDIFINLIDYLSKDDSGKILMFLIWSLYMVCNKIVEYNNNENKIVFSPLLKCSTHKKIFMNNYIIKLDHYINNHKNNFFNNSAVYYYSNIENYVLGELIKSYSKVLYDQNNNYKINLNIKLIFQLIENLNSVKIENAQSNLTNNENYQKFLENIDIEINENNQSDFQILDEIESTEIYQLFIQFINENIYFKKDYKIENDTIIREYNNKNIFYYNDDILIPIDTLNSTTQIVICIGNANENTNNAKRKSNDNNRIFNYILNNKNIDCKDYYIFQWYKSKNIKKSAEIYGKLLAYIISSREIFKFQSISILCLKEGGNVFQYFIEEIIKIGAIIDINDLLQDIYLIDTKIDLDFNSQEIEEFRKLIAGNIFNVYSDKKYFIQISFNNDSENNNNIINNNNYLCKIYNVDLVDNLKVYNDVQFIDINEILNEIRNIILK